MNAWTCSVRDYENKSSAALRCDTNVIQCVSDQAWDQVGWILAEFFFGFFDDPSHSRGPIKSVKRKKKFFSLKRSYRFRLLHWVALKGEKKLPICLSFTTVFHFAMVGACSPLYFKTAGRIFYVRYWFSLLLNWKIRSLRHYKFSKSSMFFLISWSP